MKKRMYGFLICAIIILGCLITLKNTYAADGIIWQKMDMSTFRADKGGKEYYESPRIEGYVFAGWYLEEQGNAVSEDVVSGEAYAKFVKKEVLSVKGQLSVDADVESDSTYLRMITSVDSLQYSAVGFRVKILDKTSERWSTTAYDTLSGYMDETQQCYTPSVFSDISKYFVAYRMTKIPNSAFLTGITITPMWITLDGTTVEGISRCITVHEGIGEEASVVTVENVEDRNHVYCTVNKPVKSGNTVTFDVNMQPSQEVEICVLGEGSWNKEYFSERYTISGIQSIQASVPETVDKFVLYAKFKDTTQDYSENVVAFKNIRIMGRMSEKTETENSGASDEVSYGEVWSAPSTVKIAQDNLNYADKGAATLTYEAVRNEYESKQLIITASKDVSSFTLIPADLSSGTNVINADNVEVYVEKYIIDCEDSLSNSDWADAYEKSSMPDALIPMEAAANYGENAIAANKNGALWVTVYVPKNTAAGTYSGTFQLIAEGADGKQTLDIPVSLKVYDYTLSDETTAKTLFSWRYDRVAAGELDGSIDMMTYYYEFFQDYRISLQTLPVETLSAKEFSDMAVKYYDDFTTYSLLSNVGDISIGITDYAEEIIEQVLAIAKASAKQNRNLFEKAMIYTIDEPDLTTEAGRNSVINQSQSLYVILSKCVSLIEADTSDTYEVFKAMANWQNAILDIPNIIPISNTKWLCGSDYYDNSTVKAEVHAFLETMTAEQMPKLCLCPLFTGYMEKDSGSYKNSYSSLSSLQSTYGFDLWWYGCLGPEASWPTYHILDTNLLSARTVSWLQLKYNVTGNLYWDASAYTSEIGAHYNQYVNLYETGKRVGVAGDGFLTYPGAAYGVYGPIPSMRLMSIRDGMEEYEILKDVKESKSDYKMYSQFYSKLVDSNKFLGYKTYISSMKEDSDGWFDELRKELLKEAEALTTTGADRISDTHGYAIAYTKDNDLLTQAEYREDICTELLFSFESYKDITGTALRVSGLLGETNINKNVSRISEGKASWKIAPQGDYGKNDSWPYVKLQCTDDDFADSTFIKSDFSGYDKLWLDVYNDSDEGVRIKWTLTVLNSQGDAVETEPAYFLLQPNTWTTCEYGLMDSIYSTYLKLDNVEYITFTFLTQKENKEDSVPVLYLDNLRGHTLEEARETSTYKSVFANGIGFENTLDIYSFAGYGGSNKLSLSRITYADTDILPKDKTFGDYVMQGVATDAIWPMFTANFDTTYSAGKILRFWLYLDVDESVASGKQYNIEASGHKVLTSSYYFNEWMLVDVQLLSDVSSVTMFVNFDKDGSGWYSKMEDASVHVYMDNFRVYDALDVTDRTTTAEDGTVTLENQDGNNWVEYYFNVSNMNLRAGDTVSVTFDLAQAGPIEVWSALYVNGAEKMADNITGRTRTIRVKLTENCATLMLLVKNFKVTTWENTVTIQPLSITRGEMTPDDSYDITNNVTGGSGSNWEELWP